MRDTSIIPNGRPTDGADAEICLADYGIVRVLAWRYEVDGYSYTQEADAIAQAKRSLAAAPR